MSIYSKTIGRLKLQYQIALYIGIIFDILVVIVTKYDFSRNIELYIYTLLVIIGITFLFLIGLIQALLKESDRIITEHQNEKNIESKIMKEEYLKESARIKAQKDMGVHHNQHSRNSNVNKVQHSILKDDISSDTLRKSYSEKQKETNKKVKNLVWGDK